MAAVKSELEPARLAEANDPNASTAARSTRAKAEELAKRVELEELLLKVSATTAQVRCQQQEIELQRSRSLLEFKRWQVSGLQVRAGIVAGRVAGIDPAVSAATGTLTVYVTLEGKPPKGVRPGSHVEVAIELERLSDVLHVQRPVNGQAHSQASLFKLTDAGASAIRVPVKLGRSSITEIEVLEGLQAGDEVILSDMSSAADSSRIQLR